MIEASHLYPSPPQDARQPPQSRQEPRLEIDRRRGGDHLGRMDASRVKIDLEEMNYNSFFSEIRQKTGATTPASCE